MVGQILKKYYVDDPKHEGVQFGYIVCKLQEGREQKYYPFGYSHQMYRNNLLFLPTRHYHANQGEENVIHYDHDRYSINTKNLCGSEKWDFSFPNKNNLVSFNKMTIKKNDLNTDIYFYLETHIDAFGQYHGVDGCVFKTNNPEITFKDNGSIYTSVFYCG